MEKERGGVCLGVETAGLNPTRSVLMRLTNSPPSPHKWVRVRTCQDIMWVFILCTDLLGIGLTGIDRGKDGCLSAYVKNSHVQGR